MLNCSVVSNSATSWAAAGQAPLSIRILQARVLEWVSVSSSSDGVLHSHNKEWDHAICSNMDRPQEHYANWDKLHRERRVLCDSFWTWNLKKPNSWNRECIVVSRGREVRGVRSWWSKGTEPQLWNELSSEELMHPLGPGPNSPALYTYPVTETLILWGDGGFNLPVVIISQYIPVSKCHAVLLTRTYFPCQWHLS